MEIRQFLIDSFRYNDYANKLVLNKIKALPDKEEALKLYSHLINSQYKWLARITDNENSVKLDWFGPVYSLDEIENKWEHSLGKWINFLSLKTEEQMFEYVVYTGQDGGKWTAMLKDIAIQLNNHSIHHRAQIQKIIRQQGLEPDFVDYIGTVCKKLS